MELIPLNLPAFPFKLKEKNGQFFLFDEQRKKEVLLTPEEWVRQHFVQYLILKKGYPKSLIAIEKGMLLNELQKRTDILVYNRNHEPSIIIECKAPHIPITQSVFDQVARYNSKYQMKYLVVSNGLEHFYCEMDYINQSYQFIEDLPNY